MKFIPFLLLCLMVLFSCSERETNETTDQALVTDTLAVEENITVSEPESTEEANAEIQGDPYYALVQDLNIREEPKLDGEWVSSIGYGEKVFWLGEVGGEELSLKLKGVQRTGKWYKIITSKGKTGWTFAGGLMSDEDVIKVGPTRKFKDLETALASTKGNTIVHIDEGKYASNLEISVGGYAVKATPEEIEAGLASPSGYISYDCKNTLIEGIGNVELVCTDLDANVMWIGSDDITLRNLKLRHEPKAKDKDIGCSGNVVTLDIGENLTIENCDLNGCGRVGLYYNTGPTKVVLRNNHIWNNSYCAIIDGNGNELFSEVKNHDHITFEGNVIEKNGEGGNYIPEADFESQEDYEAEYDGH